MSTDPGGDDKRRAVQTRLRVLPSPCACGGAFFDHLQPGGPCSHCSSCHEWHEPQERVRARQARVDGEAVDFGDREPFLDVRDSDQILQLMAPFEQDLLRVGGWATQPSLYMIFAIPSSERTVTGVAFAEVDIDPDEWHPSPETMLCAIATACAASRKPADWMRPPDENHVAVAVGFAFEVFIGSTGLIGVTEEELPPDLPPDSAHLFYALDLDWRHYLAGTVQSTGEQRRELVTDQALKRFDGIIEPDTPHWIIQAQQSRVSAALKVLTAIMRGT